MTIAASMMADTKTVLQRSHRVATQEEDQKTVQRTVFPTIGQPLSLPNMISMRLLDQ